MRASNRFKIDENLPGDLANLLEGAGHDATTVSRQWLGGAADRDVIAACLQEGRVFVTLDLDFADIRHYPPKEHAGLIVLRLGRQDKATVTDVFERLLNMLTGESVEGRLWIVEEDRVRIRE